MRTIGLPSGKSITLAEYIRSWKIVKTLPPEREVAGWSHFPVCAAWVLADIRYGINDRINQRAGIDLGQDMSASRARRNLVRTVNCECRWCGQSLHEYRPLHARFCDSECRRAHAS